MLRFPTAAGVKPWERCLIVLISSQWGDTTNLFLLATNILLFGGIMFLFSAGTLGAATQFGKFKAPKLRERKKKQTKKVLSYK